jgi:hypothetical protein
MKKAFLVIILLISISSCKWNDKNDSIWTKEYELKLYREIDAEVSERLPDDDKRQKLVAFIIKRLKEELPQGVESVSKDSLQILSVKIGKEYGYANAGNNSGIIPKLVPWSPAIEETIHEVLLKDVKEEDKRESELLFKCVIAHLKKTNPDSVMMPISQEISESVAKDCFFEVTEGSK